MAKLQFGLTGKYRGRGLLRRIIGSGSIRITPVDITLAEKDIDRARAATDTLWELVREAASSTVHIGSIVDLIDVRPFIYLRED